MKILVPVKRTLDAYIKVRVLSDNTAVDLANAKMAMNPFCEIALEEAVRLKEAGHATEVIAVSIGADKVQDQLRTALALGADRGIHIRAADGLESLNVAKLLRAIALREEPGLILLGKQAIDSDNNQVGQMLAALLGRPLASFASKLEITGSRILVTREVDGGEQVLSVSLPAVITADLRLNEPRYAKLPDIMKARKKPLEVLDTAALGVTLKSHYEVIQVTEPAPRKAGIRVASAAELVDRLRNEVGVLS